jgi:hypothetical protein
MDEHPYQSPQANNAPKVPAGAPLFDIGSKKLLHFIVAFIALLLLGGAAFSILARILWPDYPAD